MSHLPLYRAIL